MTSFFNLHRYNTYLDQQKIQKALLKETEKIRTQSLAISKEIESKLNDAQMYPM